MCSFSTSGEELILSSFWFAVLVVARLCKQRFYPRVLDMLLELSCTISFICLVLSGRKIVMLMPLLSDGAAGAARPSLLSCASPSTFSCFSLRGAPIVRLSRCTSSVDRPSLTIKGHKGPWGELCIQQ